MRRWVVSLCVALGLFVTGCEEVARVAPSPSEDRAAQAPTPPEVTPPVLSDAGWSELASPVTVSGHLVDPSGDPIGGRGITLVDEGGAPVLTTTDDGGSFTFPGVSPPYDLAVASPGAGALAAVAYLGLQTSVVVLRGSVSSQPRGAGVDVTFAAFDCGTPSCSVSAWTQSTDDGSVGSGSVQTAYFPAAGATVSIPVPHSWIGAPQTTVVTRVLVWDASVSSFWWASGGDVTVEDGTQIEAGPYDLEAVPSGGTTTAQVSMVGIAPGWGMPVVQFVFDYPDGIGQAVFVEPNGLSASSAIPAMPGAAVQVLSAVLDPGSYASALALSSPAPVTVGSAAVSLVAPPELSMPVDGGALQGADTIAWADGAPSAADYELHLVAQGAASPVTVHVADKAVALSRIMALGLSLPAGAWTLDVLASRPFVPIDAYAGAEPVFTSWSQSAQVPVTLGP